MRTIIITTALIIISMVTIRILTNLNVFTQAKYLTNDEIITETKRCEKNGLKASIIYNGWNYRVWRINCMPKN